MSTGVRVLSYSGGILTLAAVLQCFGPRVQEYAYSRTLGTCTLVLWVLTQK